MDTYTQALAAFALFTVALVSLIVVSFLQDRRIKALEDHQTIRTDHADADDTYYTKPMDILTQDSGSAPSTRRELRRHRKVDGG